jgi:hypothetical protein
MTTMEEDTLITLWKSYGQKLDENLQLNRRNAEDLTKIKVKSALNSMQPVKIFTIIVGTLWVLFVDALIIRLFPVANPFFLVSAGIQVLLTKLAIGIYLYQFFLIQKVDISQPVLKTQELLTRLKSSTLWVTRILFLQLPVWTTFYWNKSMLQNGNMALYLLQAVVTLAFLFIALWLFFNIRYQNRNKRWFRFIFSGKEWQPLFRSMELLTEIETCKNESSTHPRHA